MPAGASSSFTGRPEISEVAVMLNQRAAAVVAELGLDGRREGREFVALNPTRADRHIGSFRVILQGAKQGRWKDFATGDGGDALDLVVYCRSWTKAEALKWAAGWLGLDGGRPALHPETRQGATGGTNAAKTRSEVAKLATSVARFTADTAKRTGQSECAHPQGARASGPYWTTTEAPAATRRACDIWRQHCGLFGADTAQGRYLIGRGILQPWPETLAAGDLPHPETGEVVPTLIVARHCPVVHLVRGIQRIFLTADGKKYPHGTVKMSLGSIEGGRAELLWPDADLAIAEGVESALSAWRLLRTPAWAICGAFPASLSLPERVRKVTLVADHDATGGSERKARGLAKSIRAGGRQCTVIMPDSRGADANDLLLGAG